MLERLGFGSAAGACEVSVLIGPGGVGGQVTFGSSHLVDPPCQEFSQAHEGVRGEGGWIFVIRGRGGIGGPVLEEHVPNPGS